MLKFQKTVRIPEWAMCYIVNGDRDNLLDEDIAMIEKWLDSLPSGYVLDTSLCDEEKYGSYAHNDFDHYPEFGHRKEDDPLVWYGGTPYLTVRTCVVGLWVPYEGETTKMNVLIHELDSIKDVVIYTDKEFAGNVYEATDEASSWAEAYFRHYGYKLNVEVVPSDKVKIIINDKQV